MGTHLPLRLSHRRLAGTAFLFKVEGCDPDGRPLGGPAVGGSKLPIKAPVDESSFTIRLVAGWAP